MTKVSFSYHRVLLSISLRIERGYLGRRPSCKGFSGNKRVKCALHTSILLSLPNSNLTHMVKRPNATADHIDHRIHVPDEDGHMLLYIANCGLRVPWDV